MEEAKLSKVRRTALEQTGRPMASSDGGWEWVPQDSPDSMPKKPLNILKRLIKLSQEKQSPVWSGARLPGFKPWLHCFLAV